MLKLILENAINYDTMDEAKEMIREGRSIPNSMSKFQLFGESEVVNKEHLEYCMKRRLSFEDVKELFDYGKKIGQEVFFTCMSTEYVDWCEEIGVKYYKIRFYDRHNMDLINKIGNTNKPFFISMNENDMSINGNSILQYHTIYNEKIHVLYCVPKYPAIIYSYPMFSLSWDGISDHSKSLTLLQLVKTFNKTVSYDQWFEKHVRLHDCLENAWSVTFDQLKEVLK